MAAALNDDGRDEVVAGLGPDPGAGKKVAVFSQDGNQVSTMATLESFSGMTEDAGCGQGVEVKVSRWGSTFSRIPSSISV